MIMFDFSLTPEQLEMIENMANDGVGPTTPPVSPPPMAPPTPPQTPPMAPPMDGPGPMMPPPSQPPAPAAPPVAPPTAPTAPPPGMLLNPEDLNIPNIPNLPGLTPGMGVPQPTTPPYVPPPQPPTPVPLTPELGGPEEQTGTPQLPSGGPNTKQDASTVNPYPKPEGRYKNPLDPYYIWEAENNPNLTEDSKTNIWVDGDGREDEYGLSQAARLDQLDQANEALIPEGKEKGFQNSYLIHLMFGGLLPPDGAKNPDYDAGQNGDTVGGISNTDAWGKDIYWSKPATGTYSLGDTVQTPAGEYLVVNGAEGNLALMPLKGAATNGHHFVYNMTKGEHHIGINPQTGEVWYQQAAGYTTFEGDTWKNPNAPDGPPPNNGGDNGGNNGGSNIWGGTRPTDPGDEYVGTGPQPDIFGSPSGRAGVVASAMQPSKAGFAGGNMMGGGPLASAPMAPMDFQGLGYASQRQQPAPPTPAEQSNNDYVAMLNQMMKQSLFRGQ